MPSLVWALYPEGEELRMGGCHGWKGKIWGTARGQPEVSWNALIFPIWANYSDQNRRLVVILRESSLKYAWFGCRNLSNLYGATVFYFRELVQLCYLFFTCCICSQDRVPSNKLCVCCRIAADDFCFFVTLRPLRIEKLKNISVVNPSFCCLP